MQHAKITLDDKQKTVKVGKREVHLQPKQYLILKLLMEANGEIISKRDLLNRIWGPGVENLDLKSYTIPQHISRLRRYVGRRIQTKPKWGYRWIGEPDAAH